MAVIHQQFDPEDANPDWCRRFWGPNGPDQMMGRALSSLWSNLPVDARTVPEVSKKLRQQVEDALAKMSGPKGALHACQTGDAGHYAESLEPMAGAATDPDWFSDPANLALMHDVMTKQNIDSCIMGCWGLLPTHRRTESEIANQVRRIMERVLSNLEEDDRIFRGSA